MRTYCTYLRNTLFRYGDYFASKCQYNAHLVPDAVIPSQSAQCIYNRYPLAPFTCAFCFVQGPSMTYRTLYCRIAHISAYAQSHVYFRSEEWIAVTHIFLVLSRSLVLTWVLVTWHLITWHLIRVQHGIYSHFWSFLLHLSRLHFLCIIKAII